MKQTTLLFVGLLSATITFAQNPEKAKELTQEGITLHDKGKYVEAIQKYDEALKTDENNFFAMSEKAMSLHALQKNEEAVKLCNQVIQMHPNEDDLKSVFVTCGNAYDQMKKPDLSLEKYNEGLNKFPDFYYLHYNKGITLVNMNETKEALASFEKAAFYNPMHASSHNAIARLKSVEKQRIPSLMAYLTFLMVEPTGARAVSNLEAMNTQLYGNITQKKKNKTEVTFNTDFLTGEENQENDFSTVDLTMSLTIATQIGSSKENKKMSEVEKFQKTIETFCSLLAETIDEKRGFYWTYYAPFFVELQKAKRIETFCHLVMASSDDKDVDKWLKAHREEVTDFYKWARNYDWQ